MKGKALYIFLWLLLLGVLTACSSNNPEMPDIYVPFEGRPNGLYPGSPLADAQGYVVGPRDELAFEVFRHPEFSSKYKVDMRGNIRLPLTLDYVKAQGLTLNQLEVAIAQKVRPYLRDEPKVRVQLLKPESKFVYVMGAVERPGRYPMADERIYVREAVARAGWPLDVAALERTKLVSSTPKKNVIRDIDLKDIIYRGNLTENYEMSPGDVVWVPYTRLSRFTVMARRILEPVATLVGIDTNLGQLGKAPRIIRSRSNHSMFYDERDPHEHQYDY